MMLILFSSLNEFKKASFSIIENNYADFLIVGYDSKAMNNDEYYE